MNLQISKMQTLTVLLLFGLSTFTKADPNTGNGNQWADQGFVLLIRAKGEA